MSIYLIFFMFYFEIGALDVFWIAAQYIQGNWYTNLTDQQQTDISFKEYFGNNLDYLDQMKSLN